MALINQATKELQVKVVYYGPAMGGKTTNLVQVHDHVQTSQGQKGKLVSLATSSDRTLFFDFLPIEAVAIKGFKTKFQLYTVPGQVIYNTTRQLVLRGVDGIVFVGADSQYDKMEENVKSFANLEENLQGLHLNLADIPYIILYNKRDHRLYVKKGIGMLWGPDSLVPQPKDVVQMLQHMRWFLRLGPRPQFDRYTYWEKFDYWAVFWGMGVIGTSGLMLWFPGFFARLVPGWMFNIAMVVHGEEALLAVVFIFTVHFFNGHIRPEKFPMDTVIFTGRVSLEEVEEDRPAEYARLLRDGLEVAIASPPSHRLHLAGRLIGTTAVVLGFVMVGLSIYALLAW